MRSFSKSRITLVLTAVLSVTILLSSCGSTGTSGKTKAASKSSTHSSKSYSGKSHSSKPKTKKPKISKSKAKSISVPGVVLQAFEQRHPGQQPQWEKKPYGYEAIFTENGQEYEAEYAATGEWLETEYEVEAARFSPTVLRRVSQQHPRSAVTKYEIELTPQGRFYEVEIKQQSGQERELYFDDRANPTPNSNEDL